MFPNRPELLDKIPGPADLNIAKLNKANTMTDTCNTALKHSRLLGEAIKAAARELGLIDNEIEVFEVHCWHHLRNVWFGAVIVRLNKTLNEVLESDLGEIPSILRVNSKTNIIELLRAIVKEFARTANYSKGHGSMFYTHMKLYHPKTYLYLAARALGGTRQDILEWKEPRQST